MTINLKGRFEYDYQIYLLIVSLEKKLRKKTVLKPTQVGWCNCTKVNKINSSKELDKLAP